MKIHEKASLYDSLLRDYEELIIELKNECLNAKSIQEQEEELKQFLNEEKLC